MNPKTRTLRSRVNGRATSFGCRCARSAKKSVVSLGDLISAAYEVSGSADAAALLLSPVSPLSKMLDRQIVVAT